MKNFAAIAAAFLLLSAGAPVLAQTAPVKSAPPPSSVSIEGGYEEVVIAPRQKRAVSPDGDPRSVGEVREHRAAFDRCTVTAPETDTAHPVESTPEEYCAARTGMRDHNAVPNYVSNPNKEE
jgi:hypothetical protein